MFSYLPQAPWLGRTQTMRGHSSLPSCGNIAEGWIWPGWAEEKSGEGGMFMGVYLKPFFWFGIFSSLLLLSFSFTKPYKYPCCVVWELGTLTVETKDSKDRIKHSFCLLVKPIEGTTDFLSGWRELGRSEEPFPGTRWTPSSASLQWPE